MTTIYPMRTYLEGHYPKTGQAHKAALDEVAAYMPMAVGRPFHLLAGGSTLRGQADLASDVDLLLILDIPEVNGRVSGRDFAVASLDATQVVKEASARMRVVFDFFIEAKARCCAGSHSLGYGYTQSLQTIGVSADWSEDGLSYIAWAEDAPRMELVGYLEHKIRKLQRGLYCRLDDLGSVGSCEILADALDVPFHALRRIREWRTGAWSDCSRGFLINLASDEGWLGDEEVVYLRYLVDLRQRYASLLTTRVDLSAYQLLLAEIEAAGQGSLDLLCGLRSAYGQ